MVLTHGHSDHLGFAERVRTERKVPVWIHEADAALARAEADPNNPMGKIRLAPLLGFLWLGLRNGGLSGRSSRRSRPTATGPRSTCPAARRSRWFRAIRPGARPLVSAAPCSWATRSPPTRSRMAGSARASRRSPPTAGRPLESLARIADSPAAVVLPGHGEPWTQGMAEAVRLIRASEPAVARPSTVEQPTTHQLAK